MLSINNYPPLNSLGLDRHTFERSVGGAGKVKTLPSMCAMVPEPHPFLRLSLAPGRWESQDREKEEIRGTPRRRREAMPGKADPISCKFLPRSSASVSVYFCAFARKFRTGRSRLRSVQLTCSPEPSVRLKREQSAASCGQTSYLESGSRCSPPEPSDPARSLPALGGARGPGLGAAPFPLRACATSLPPALGPARPAEQRRPVGYTAWSARPLPKGCACPLSARALSWG